MMTPAQEIYRKQLLAKIHLHPQYKFIKQNDGWSEWLSVRFGVDSCKELSIKELNIALDVLNDKRADELSLKADTLGRNLLNKTMITPKQIERILTLANELGWDEKTLIKFVNKQCKTLLLYHSYLTKLSKAQATGLIVGLQKILNSRYNNAKN